MSKRLLMGLAAAVVVAAGAAYYFFFVLNPRGSNQPAFVGMEIQGVNVDIAAALGRPNTNGVLVRDVAVDGPAGVAGFRRGDLIVRFDGQEIDSFDAMLKLVGAARADTRIPITLIRRGQELTLDLHPAAWTEAWKVERDADASIPQIGLTVAALSPEIRKRLNLPWGAVGVGVIRLDAEAKGMDLQPGEVIVQVNQQLIWQPDQLQREYAATKVAGRANMLLLVQGVAGFRFSLMPVR
jgi:serine protease Do